MSDFAVVIGYQLDNDTYKSVILDTIDDSRISGHSTITDQPLISGDVVSDHMFRQPKSMSMSGNISMNGSNVTVIDGQGSKLANFEELFETIQKQGVKCDIVKLSLNNEEDIRFIHRHNMILQSFNWQEHINCLSYTLNFREILTTSVVEYDYDVDDGYLPITDFVTSNFTDTLIDWDQIDTQLVKFLQDNELIENNFLQSLSSLGNDTLRSLVPAAVALVLVGIMVALSTNPVGWIILAVGAAVASAIIFVKGVVNFVKKSKKRWKLRAFKYYKKHTKNDAEIKRFANFLFDIHQQFKELDKVLKIYRVSENKPQEAMISVGDEYYIFTFDKNTTTDNKYYSLSVNNHLENNPASMTNISSAPISFDQLNNGNKLLTCANNATIHLLYSPVYSEDVKTESGQDNSDLRNYVILVSNINLEDYENLMSDIIKNYLVN